jgi:hypothetical protein
MDENPNVNSDRINKFLSTQYTLEDLRKIANTPTENGMFSGFTDLEKRIVHVAYGTRVMNWQTYYTKSYDDIVEPLMRQKEELGENYIPINIIHFPGDTKFPSGPPIPHLTKVCKLMVRARRDNLIDRVYMIITSRFERLITNGIVSFCGGRGVLIDVASLDVAMVRIERSLKTKKVIVTN